MTSSEVKIMAIISLFLLMGDFLISHLEVLAWPEARIAGFLVHFAFLIGCSWVATFTAARFGLLEPHIRTRMISATSIAVFLLILLMKHVPQAAGLFVRAPLLMLINFLIFNAPLYFALNYFLQRETNS